MNRQLTFFDDEFYDDLEVKRHARRTDPPTSHQAAEDIVASGKMSAQCAVILAQLRQGPATSLELSKLSLKYTSRISDLRKSGHKIKALRDTLGNWTYVLEEQSRNP